MSHSCLPNIGVFGTSRIVRTLVPKLKASGFKVTAIWGQKLQEVNSCANDLNIIFHTTKVDEVILRKDVNLIFIHCIPFLQAAITVKALSIGKHVICGIPAGPTQSDFTRMVNRALYYPTLLTSILNPLRFLPCFKSMKDLIGAGRIGDVNFCYVRIRCSDSKQGQTTRGQTGPSRAQSGSLRGRQNHVDQGEQEEQKRDMSLNADDLDHALQNSSSDYHTSNSEPHTPSHSPKITCSTRASTKSRRLRSKGVKSRSNCATIYDWRDDASQGGGVLNRYGFVVIDIVKYILDSEVKRVNGTLRTYNSYNNNKGIRLITSDDMATIQMDMESGPTVQISIDSHSYSQYTQEFRICGSKGELCIIDSELLCDSNDLSNGRCLEQSRNAAPTLKQEHSLPTPSPTTSPSNRETPSPASRLASNTSQVPSQSSPTPAFTNNTTVGNLAKNASPTSDPSPMQPVSRSLQPEIDVKASYKSNSPKCLNKSLNDENSIPSPFQHGLEMYAGRLSQVFGIETLFSGDEDFLSQCCDFVQGQKTQSVIDCIRESNLQRCWKDVITIAKDNEFPTMKSTSNINTRHSMYV